jgi:hypothetical protein
MDGVRVIPMFVNGVNVHMVGRCQASENVSDQNLDCTAIKGRLHFRSKAAQRGSPEPLSLGSLKLQMSRVVEYSLRLEPVTQMAFLLSMNAQMCLCCTLAQKL